MVGQHANALEVQVGQNLRANADFALGPPLAFRQGWQALLVMELYGHALAKPLNRIALRGRMQIDQRAAAFFRNAAHRALDHVVTSTPARAEDVAYEAMRMHAHQHRFFARVFHVALDHRNVRVAGDLRLVDDHAEVTISGWNDRLRQALHIALMRHAIAYELRDGQHLHVVLTAELGELRHARHGSVVVHDLADHARGNQTCEPRQINRGFGLPGANQHATFAGAKREDMSRTSQIVRARGRIDGDANGFGAIIG